MIECMTVSEAAKALAISEYTIREKAKRGELKAYKVGHCWRFKKIDIENYLEKNNNQHAKSAEVNLCHSQSHSIKEEKYGGIDSRHPTGSEYAHLLGL